MFYAGVQIVRIGATAAALEIEVPLVAFHTISMAFAGGALLVGGGGLLGAGGVYILAGSDCLPPRVEEWMASYH
jgi:hypothetical protein